MRIVGLVYFLSLAVYAATRLLLLAGAEPVALLAIEDFNDAARVQAPLAAEFDATTDASDTIEVLHGQRRA